MDMALVFGIIFAAIVMGLLVFFGFKYINEMFAMSCESQTGQLTENLKNVVRSTSALSKGSVQEFKIIVQSTCATRICFVDPQHPEIENTEGKWVPDELTTYLVSRNKYNLIITEKDGGIKGYIIEKLKPYVNFCLTSTRDVTIRNTGAMVEITLPEF
jgi:hypothetical protein